MMTPTMLLKSKTVILGFVAVLISIITVSAFAQAEPAPIRQATFMRAKLSASQEILEGLALSNYGGIAKNAAKLKALSQDAQWNVLETPDYARHSEEFRRAADALMAAADAKNLDGATLAYFQMTMTCVRCHQYVRDSRDK